MTFKDLVNLMKEQNKLLFVHIATILVFSVIYYFMAPHKGTKKDKENFKSFESSLYYTTITHFTVGFGDISPESPFLRRLTMFQVLLAFSLMNR